MLTVRADSAEPVSPFRGENFFPMENFGWEARSAPVPPVAAPSSSSMVDPRQEILPSEHQVSPSSPPMLF